jgi:hypothetical protein
MFALLGIPSPYGGHLDWQSRQDIDADEAKEEDADTDNGVPEEQDKRREGDGSNGLVQRISEPLTLFYEREENPWDCTYGIPVPRLHNTHDILHEAHDALVSAPCFGKLLTRSA